MLAIFKRETRSYFTSVVGYVIIAAIFAFVALYYAANNLILGSPDFASILYYSVMVLLFVLPALSMRSFADERRNKTDQLLLTSPVGIPSIVLGKYLAQLVKRAQMGDSDAFAELYVATYQKQYQFSYRYLRDEFLAQDALQETYILALKNITTLRDPTVFVSWLNQINMRVCFDMYRKQRMYETEQNQYDENSLRRKEQRGDNASPELLAIQADQEEHLIKQIMSLPFSESQAIILRYYRNMKIEEIAKMMDISVSSVKRYLQSGRKMLAKSIER